MPQPALHSNPQNSSPRTAVFQPLSYERFLAVVEEEARAEWVRGEMVAMSPVSHRHQRLADFLTALLKLYTEAKDLGEVCSASFQMKMEHSGREPDLLFVAREHLDRFRESYLDGPADVAVEIISPESRARDRGEKFYEYEAAGVREYWLLDPLRRQAEFYRLSEDGIYRPMAADADVFESTVVEGFWLRVEWLWREPPPKVMEVVREWGLLD